nr:hypothetical protein [Candidatus Erwinia dacicola]
MQGHHPAVKIYHAGTTRLMLWEKVSLLSHIIPVSDIRLLTSASHRLCGTDANDTLALNLPLNTPINHKQNGSYGHLWYMGIQGRWRILLIDFF